MTAGHDWYTFCNRNRESQFIYKIPGHLDLNFIFNRNDWMAARVYYLTGSYPTRRGTTAVLEYPESSERCRKMIFSYLHTLKWKFERRCTLKAEDLCPEDIEWGERAAALADRDGSMVAQLAELREKGDMTRGPRRHQYRIDIVTEAMRRDPELTKRLVSELEGSGVVEMEGEGWALAKQGVSSESGEDGPADCETHSWRPLLPGRILGSSRGSGKGWPDETS